MSIAFRGVRRRCGRRRTAAGSSPPGGDRPAQVPLDVDETGGLDDPDHERRLVQDEVEVDLVAEPLVEVADLGSGVQAEDQPARRDRAGGPGPRPRRAARRPPGGSASTTPARPPTRSWWRAAQPPQVADLEIPAREAPAGLGHHRGREVDRPSRRRRRSARYAVTCPGPEPTSTTGRPPAWASTRSSSQVSNGSPASSSTRWSAYAVATASYDERTRASRTSAPSAITDVPVDRRRGDAARPAPGPVRGDAPSAGPAARAAARARAPGARARSAIRRRHASTSPRSANACSRSVRVRSSPGACAPRSSSTVSSARSSGSSPSRSSRIWWYFSVRRPGVRPHDPHQLRAP